MIKFAATSPYPSDIYEAYGTSDQRHWTFGWDLSTGLPTSETDADNSAITSAGYDPRGRITSLNQAGLKQTATVYSDAAQTVTTTLAIY